MNNLGGYREGSGRKNQWGFPTSDLKVKKLPYQVADILDNIKKCYQGEQLLIALTSLINDSVRLTEKVTLSSEKVTIPTEQVTKSIDKVTQLMVIPALKKYICNLINVSEKTADRRIRKAKEALGITGAITPERQTERYQIVQYILDNEPEKVTF